MASGTEVSGCPESSEVESRPPSLVSAAVPYLISACIVRLAYRGRAAAHHIDRHRSPGRGLQGHQLCCGCPPVANDSELLLPGQRVRTAERRMRGAQAPRRVVTQAIFKKAQKAIKAAPQKAQSAVKGAQSQAKKVQRQAPAPLKKAQGAAKKAQKKAPSPIKKAQSALKSGTKRTKGWFGGAGGAQDLDKWYGARPAEHLPPRPG